MTYFRQHEERHLSSEYKIMKWNPKFDLFAIAHKTADVAVYRLVGWQKVWELLSPSAQVPVQAATTTSNTPTVPPNDPRSRSSQYRIMHQITAKSSPVGTTNCSELPEIQVSAMDWRPDGKVLAVAYNRNLHPKHGAQIPEHSSSISLVDVENGHVFRMLEVDTGVVTSLCWEQFEQNVSLDKTNTSCSESNTSSAEANTSTTESAKFPLDQLLIDSEENSYLPEYIEFLPQLPPLIRSFADKQDMPNFLQATSASAGSSSTTQPVISNRAEDAVDDLIKVSGQKTLNVLAVGTDRGAIHLYCLGVFRCGLIVLAGAPRIVHLSLAGDFEYINVIYEQGTLHTPTRASRSTFQQQQDKPGMSTHTLSTYSIENLKESRQQYFHVSIIYCKLISLLKYLHECMQRMYELWEEILIEIDNKLSNYLLNDRKKTGGKSSGKEVLLADDFLELLTFGSLTDTLEKFLHNFTEKGLKKLGGSIENTYHAMQKLIVLHIQPVTQHVFCYVQTLRAITQWRSEYAQVGMEKDCVMNAIKCIGSFHMKTVEMQRVLDHSIRNVKCFFKWLYTMMVKVYGDALPPSQQEQCKITWADMQFVADFIQENFEHDEPLENLADASSFFLDLGTASLLGVCRSPSYSDRTESVSITEPLRKSRAAANKKGTKPNDQSTSRPARHYTPLQQSGSSSQQPSSAQLLPRPPHRPTASNFTLERVGQYLKDAPLSYTSPTMNDINLNNWINYVVQHKLDTKESAGQALVHSHNGHSSLLQEYRQVERSVRKIFDSSFSCFCSKLSSEKAQVSSLVAQLSSSHERARFTHNAQQAIAFATEDHLLQILKLELHTGAIQSYRVRFVFEDAERLLEILDVQYYHGDILTLLLQEVNSSDGPLLVQFNSIELLDNCFEAPFFCGYSHIVHNTTPFTIDVRFALNMSTTPEPSPIQVRRLENIRVASLSVSGTRKVSAVASVSRRRVRIFEMDACEDEAEMEEDDSEQSSIDRSTISRGDRSL